MIKNKTLISGSLSCVDILNLKDALDDINASSIDFIHYDVVDGEFNNCFVFGDLVLEKVRPHTNKKIEVHLAVNDIDKYLEPFIKAGADYIAIHYEVDVDHNALFDRIRYLGAKPVLAFKSNTEVPDDFIEYASKVEWILKLTVNPGYAGQVIQPQAIAHVCEMRKRLDEAKMSTRIQADGNINESTVPLLIQAGADILTGGTSGLFNTKGTIEENYQKLIEASLKQ